MTKKHKIEEVYIFVAIGEKGECAAAFIRNLGEGQHLSMPLIAADKERVDSLRPYAVEIAKETGKTIKLIKFTTREDVEEIKGD